MSPVLPFRNGKRRKTNTSEFLQTRQVGATHFDYVTTNIVIPLPRSHHLCRERKQELILREDTDKRSSSKVADNWIYTETGYYEIKKTLSDNTFKCHPIVTGNYETTELHLPLPWGDVGVSKFSHVDTSLEVTVTREEIKGKLMLCGNTVNEWEPPWFRDSKRDY